MHIINTFDNIQCLKGSGMISKPLASHLEKKLAALRVALEPETELTDFSLAMHGPLWILEIGERSLSPIGLPDSLGNVIPEWVSRLKLGEEVYYVLYVMSDNDYVVQIYIHDAAVDGAIREWLAEQSVEEEEGEYGDEFKPAYPF